MKFRNPNGASGEQQTAVLVTRSLGHTHARGADVLHDDDPVRTTRHLGVPNSVSTRQIWYGVSRTFAEVSVQLNSKGKLHYSMVAQFK